MQFNSSYITCDCCGGKGYERFYDRGELSKEWPCGPCGGSGEVEICYDCQGSGEHLFHNSVGQECGEPCSTCGGDGVFFLGDPVEPPPPTPIECEHLGIF